MLRAAQIKDDDLRAPSGEALLVSRAKDLDPQAWSYIYRLHYAKIYGYVRRRVTSNSAAEDLTSSVFLRALEGIRKYKYRCTPLVAWLISISRNLITDCYRQTSRSREQPLDEELASKEPSPEQATSEATELRNHLQKALGQLTKEQRQIVLLRFVEGLKTREVACVLKRNEGAVRAAQHRALASLRRLLQREEAHV